MTRAVVSCSLMFFVFGKLCADIRTAGGPAAEAMRQDVVSYRLMFFFFGKLCSDIRTIDGPPAEAMRQAVSVRLMFFFFGKLCSDIRTIDGPAAEAMRQAVVSVRLMFFFFGKLCSDIRTIDGPAAEAMRQAVVSCRLMFFFFGKLCSDIRTADGPAAEAMRRAAPGMSVNALLHYNIRLERKHVATHLVQQRALSGADAVNALRPFYFAVHPDFFGQHPREREVNENSLKRLNSYLDNLQKPGSHSLQPMKLTFYVRDTKDSSDVQQDDLPSGFRSVSFTLHTNDVWSTVMDVLKSCSLSMEHLRELKAIAETSKSPPKAGMPFYRPIKWDKSYYTFTGFRDPEQELQQARRVEPTLSLWLRNNEPEATKKLHASLPRREELNRLKEELCHKFNLVDIRWQRSWGLAHRCSQLQSLSRLSQQNPEALINLQGHTVMFADQSGMNASGHVMLGTMDVHHQWTKLFEQLSSYRSLHQQTEWLKERISLLLGGTQVIHLERFGPVQPIAEHYSTLSAFHKNLMSQHLGLHPRSLQGLTMLLNDRTDPSLHEMGHFIIPTNCDPPKLQVFLQRHAAEARQRTQRQKQLQAEEEAKVKQCLYSLSLRSLSKEPSVSCSQMILCCKRLMEQRFPLMQGLHVCVSHFFSVMQDGDLCVPWDWKS